MEIANAEQAAAWDGHEGEVWTEHADRYDRASRRHWQRFLDAGLISVADDVLDIGCGTGKATRDVARLAAQGSVLGVDLSATMLETSPRAERSRRSDERHVRARRRPGPPVRRRRVRCRDEQLRRHVLQRSGGSVHEHRPRRALRRTAGIAGLARAPA